jgi:hypothetical protein
MIKVKKIEVPTIDLYSPDDTHLGLLNEYEFLDARVQIRKFQKTGYYVIYDNKKIKITKNGKLEEYPKGLFDQLASLYIKFI